MERKCYFSDRNTEEAPVNSEVTAKLPPQQACNSDVTSYSGWANPNLFYFNTVTKKGVSQLLSHTSEVSSMMYLVLIGHQTDYLTGSGCGCRKISLVSVIVIHNVIYITWCNYCRVNKGTSTKGIIFVIYRDLCHILLNISCQCKNSANLKKISLSCPYLNPAFLSLYQHCSGFYVRRGQSQDWFSP